MLAAIERFSCRFAVSIIGLVRNPWRRATYATTSGRKLQSTPVAFLQVITTKPYRHWLMNLIAWGDGGRGVPEIYRGLETSVNANLVGLSAAKYIWRRTSVPNCPADAVSIVRGNTPLSIVQLPRSSQTGAYCPAATNSR